MAPISSGPCEPWGIACVTFPQEAAAVSGMAIEAATEILWERSGRQFGICEMTLRPCRDGCNDLPLLALYGNWWPTWGEGSGPGYPYPAIIGGRWWNLGCGSCSGTCSCTELHQAELPYPVVAVSEVKLDGSVLNPTSYRVDDWRYLVRLDGGRWPECQDMSRPDTEDNTWSVTLTVGQTVPASGEFAAGALALEIARGCLGEACGLPVGITKSVTRQGVVKQLLAENSSDSIMAIPAVNRFLQTYNPARSAAAFIYSIDSPSPRRTNTGS